MAESKHTPGPWEAWKSPSGVWTVRAVYRDNQDRRCTAWPAICDAGAQDNEANARLIAAAPEMLEALRKADQFITNGIETGYIRMPDAPDPALDTPGIIRAAIAKATGGSDA